MVAVRRCRLIVLRNRLIWLAVLAHSCSPLRAAGPCEPLEERFKAFRSKYQLTGQSRPGGPTLRDVVDELGDPSGLATPGKGYVAIYRVPNCVGRVAMNGDLRVLSLTAAPDDRATTSTVAASSASEAELQQLRARTQILESLTQTEQQARELQARLATLQDRAAALQALNAILSRNIRFVEESAAEPLRSDSEASGSTGSTSATQTEEVRAKPRMPAEGLLPPARPTGGSARSRASDPTIYTGPRGGRYRLSPSGRKVYLPRK